MKKEDYVSLELAKLLKEKGYNEYCGAYYHLNWEDVTEKERFEIAPDHDFRNRDNGYRVGAPTLYEAQKWLRCAHHIHVSVHITYLAWEFAIFNITESRCLIFDTSHYETYEETLNTGILEALKMI